MRFAARKFEAVRDVTIEKDFIKHADGSCLISYGNTKVVCTANIEEKVPSFLMYKNSGWVSAEYGMLPGSTHSRMKRESASGKQTGRTQEIQRLIARCLRSSIDLKLLGNRQIILDCDVIQADGGTRTASITGGYVALSLAIKKLISKNLVKNNVFKKQIAAISCGIVDGNILADLDYSEDSNAEIDANFVLDSDLNIVEIQATAEKRAFNKLEFDQMLTLAENNIKILFEIQNEILNNS